MNQGQVFSEIFSAACKESLPGMADKDRAKLLGISPSMYSAYSSGKKLPSMGRAITIANTLGVCVEWLLTGKGPKHHEQQSEQIDSGTLAVAIALQRMPEALRTELQKLILRYHQ